MLLSTIVYGSFGESWQLAGAYRKRGSLHKLEDGYNHSVGEAKTISFLARLGGLRADLPL